MDITNATHINPYISPSVKTPDIKEDVNKMQIAEQNATKTTPTGKPFGKIFDSAISMIDETNQYQKDATQLQVDFATGKTDDILAVTMAQEKAMATLTYTVQVTNKMLEAYREIMQIQL